MHDEADEYLAIEATEDEEDLALAEVWSFSFNGELNSSCETLTSREKAELNKFLYDNWSSFAKSVQELGCCTKRC